MTKLVPKKIGKIIRLLVFRLAKSRKFIILSSNNQGFARRVFETENQYKRSKTIPNSVANSLEHRYKNHARKKDTEMMEKAHQNFFFFFPIRPLIVISEKEARSKAVQSCAFIVISAVFQWGFRSKSDSRCLHRCCYVDRCDLVIFHRAVT